VWAASKGHKPAKNNRAKQKAATTVTAPT